MVEKMPTVSVPFTKLPQDALFITENSRGVMTLFQKSGPNGGAYLGGLIPGLEDLASPEKEIPFPGDYEVQQVLLPSSCLRKKEA
jgi:hypothetical protein